MSVCLICDHPQRAEIDSALAAGASLRNVEDLYKVSRSTLSRHARHKEHTVMSQDHATAVPTLDETATMPDFAELMRLAGGLIAQSEYASNQQTALLLAKNLAKFAAHLLH